MSCGICGGLRGGEGWCGKPGDPEPAACKRLPACVRAAPGYFGRNEKLAAGVVPRVSGCPSTACAMGQQCLEPERCRRSNSTLDALRAKVDEPAQPPTIEQFMNGDARPRDIYGEPIPEGRIGAWVQTASGRKVWPLDPRPEDIALLDVARGLANECRYGRQLKRRGLWLSVAEHSVLVARHVAKRFPGRGWEREALLHDADEAYGFGDIPRPLKHDPSILPLVQPLEERWQKAVFTRFGVTSTPESRAAVKEIDNLIILDEIPAVTRDPSLYAIRHPETERVQRLGAVIWCWPAELAERHFLAAFSRLFPEHAAEAKRLLLDAYEV